MKTTKRCSKCWKAVTPDECEEWAGDPKWFAYGEGMIKALNAIGKKKGEKKPKPVKRTYHRVYSQQRERWEARGKAMLCGEIRDSHPEEDRFEFLMSRLPSYRGYQAAPPQAARPSPGRGRLA